MKGKITISRQSSNKGNGIISIQIKDELSSIEFVEAKISLADFAEAITGLAYIDCDISVNGLDKVGMQIERKTLEFEIPETTYSERKDIAYDEAKKLCDDGWIASSYFSSQSSFFQKDGKNFARTSASRWVEVK